MSNTDWKKFPVLFSLYIAQSIPMSFFSTVVPVIMRQEHYSLTSIGLLQLVKLPWIFKFLWAPAVDNATHTTSNIKKWIIGSEIFYAVIILGIGFFNLQTDFKTIIVLIVIAFIASATQDIATDKFAIRILKKDEKSLGNSMQSAGSFVGSLIGTGVLLLAYYYFGWQVLLVLLALFVLFAIIPVSIYGKNSEEVQTEKHRVKIKDIFNFFSTKSNIKHLFLLMFYYSGIIGILAMLKPYMVDLGYNVKEIGFISGIFGTAMAGVASIISGFVMRKIGKVRSLYIFAIINILTAIYFYIMAVNPHDILWLYIGVGLLWSSYGLSTVVIYTISMDKVREKSQGTDFTSQIVITHLSSLIIAVASGKIAHSIDYDGLYIFEIIMGIIALFMVTLNYSGIKFSHETTN